jgi:hypothetical protein
MEMIEQLGVALGLASLAGINLYLTVLIAGLAVRMDWVALSGSHAHLEALGHPWVLAVAGVFFVMEFFADKVPWVDTLWDSVHTVIRPVGGTLLALQALGEMPPYLEVISALAAGTAALTTHSAKAGSRMVINHSPEPFTNVSMSMAEDAAVAGGMGLVLFHPVAGFGVFAGVLAVIWLVFPKLFRIIRSTLWLVWNKVRMPGRREAGVERVDLKAELPVDVLGLLAVKADTAEHDVAWTVECLTGKSKGVKGVRANVKTVVVARKARGTVLLVLRGMFRDQVVALPLEGARVEVESRLLSDHVVVQTAARMVTLRFPRGCGALVETVRARLEEQAGAELPEVGEGAARVAPAPEVAPLPALEAVV